MADEPRRSGRATKGQHTKNNDETPAPSKKGQKGRKKGAKATSDEPEDGDEDDAVIRCVCGDREEVDGLTENPKMICCDKCEAWQHNVCMGISEDDKLLPEQYFCEQCKPVNHKELLAAISRGERPWEERLNQLKEQERLKKSKKSRKSKGGRTSAVGTESEPATTPKSTAVDAATPQPSVGSRRKPGPADAEAQAQAQTQTQTQGTTPTAPQAAATPTAYVEITKTQRRKSTHPTDENPLKRRQSAKLDENALKRRKSSIAFDPPVSHIDELPDDRKKTAQPLYKQIKGLVEATVKSGSYALETDENDEPVEGPDERAARLARDIEYEVYVRFPRPEEVTAKNDQLRSIIFNFKKNQALFLDILKNTLTPEELAYMSSEDMASEELQKERAALKEEADKQAIIHHEEGPRVRKTHKGDELVVGEDEQHRAMPEPIFVPRASSRSVAAESTDAAQSPAGVPASPITARTELSVEKPLTVNTTVESPIPHHERKPSNNFDIHSVWSKVRSPEVPQGVFTPKTPSVPPAPFAVRGPGEDADIDRLLKDDEMEGVSPTSGTAGVWRGNLYMKKQPSSINVLGTAQFFGGADASLDLPWGELINGDVEINGRIASEKADEYLGNFRWSTTRILSILKFVPDPQPAVENGENGETKSSFAQIFDYFVGHSRWGVSKSHNQANALKDFYIVPVRAGDSALPKCLEYMENVHLEGPRAEDVIYFVLIVQVRDSPPGDRPPSALPPPVSTPQTAAPPGDPFGPLPSGTGNNRPASPSQLDGDPGIAAPVPGPDFNPPQIAVEILGEFIHTPVARSVLQLPDISRQQLENLKHAFQTDPMTRQDLKYLSQFLKAEGAQTADEQHQ